MNHINENIKNNTQEQYYNSLKNIQNSKDGKSYEKIYNIIISDDDNDELKLVLKKNF